MTVEISIRPARVDDLELLARIHARTWRETYGGILPEALIAEQTSLDRRREVWRADLANPEALERLWIGLIDDEPAGFVQSTPTLEPDAPRPLELRRLYTLAWSHGSGLSHALIDAAVGDAPAWLWMLDGNDRAEAFYRKHGFRRETPPFTREWDDNVDIRLVR